MSLLRAVLIILLVPSLGSAQALRGRVIDEASGSPVPQARISILAAANDSVLASATSNSEGVFVADLPYEGIFRVRVESIGYTTHTTAQVAVPRGTLVTVELRIRTSAIALEPLRVVAQRDEPHFMRDVRRRMKMGFGKLVDRVELDERVELRSVLESVAGVRTFLYDGAPLVQTRANSMAGGRECYAALYHNGTRVFSAEDSERLRPRNLPQPNIDSIDISQRLKEYFATRPNDIEAIEIYRGAAEVPAEFSGSNAECGVVAIWFRSGFERRADDDLSITSPFSFHVYASANRLSGGPEISPGAGIGASAGVRLIGGLSLHAHATRHAHELAERSITYLTADLDPESVILPTGPHPMTVIGAGIEPRFTLRRDARLRPVLAARASWLRRSFELSDANVEHRSSTLHSNGTGIGASAGAEYDVAGRLVVQILFAAERLSFEPFETLERPTRPTAADWTSFGLKLGFSWARAGRP